MEPSNTNIQKINNDYDLVVTAFNYKEDKENCTIDVAIPYINVNQLLAKKFNRIVKQIYRKKAETLKNQISSMNTIYTVHYDANGGTDTGTNSVSGYFRMDDTRHVRGITTNLRKNLAIKF